MKKYIIPVTILSASGCQIYGCEAESKEEALEKFKNGECDFVEEEVEITNLDFDNLEMDEIEELDP